MQSCTHFTEDKTCNQSCLNKLSPDIGMINYILFCDEKITAGVR